MMNYMKNLIYSMIDADEETKLSRITLYRVLTKKLQTTKFKLNSYESEALFPNSKFIEPSSLYQRVYCKIQKLDATEEETVTLIFKLEIRNAQNMPITKIINNFHGITKEGQFHKVLAREGSALICTPTLLEVTATHIILDDTIAEYEVRRTQWFGCKHFQAILDSLAAYHAFSFNLKMLHKKKRSRPFLGSHSYMAEEILYNKQYTVSRKLKRQEYNCHLFLIDLLNEGESVKNEIKVKFKRKFEEFYTNLKSVDHAHHVFSYFDPWGVDNFLFKYEFATVSKCYLFDFTFVRYLPPTHDVLSAIYFNSTPKFRDEHCGFLLNYYYEQLTDRLKEYDFKPDETYPRAAFDKSCNDYLLTVLYFNVNYKVNALLGRKKFDEYFDGDDVIIHYLLNDRARHVENFMSTNKCYKGNLMEEYKEFVYELMKS